MRSLLIFAFCFALPACGTSAPNMESDAAGEPDSQAPDPDASHTGAMYTGSVIAGGLPVDSGSIELVWEGGTANIPIDENGEFSYEFPELGVDYQAIIPGTPGNWGHSSWLRNVPTEGYTDISYNLGADSVFDGFSNVLGPPRIEAEGGLISLEIQINEEEIGGQGFTIDAASDPVFVFNSEGLPVRSPTLLVGGAGLLLFGNVAPQRLPRATPNEITNCVQVDPESEVRAKTVLILVIRCE